MINLSEMLKNALIITTILFITGCSTSPETWTIDSQNEWQLVIDKTNEIEIKDGLIHFKSDSVSFSATLQEFGEKKKLHSITIKQHPQWNTWKAIPKITPDEIRDAPVFIPVADNDYWLLGRYQHDFENGYHAWHSTDMKEWIHHGPVSTGENRWVTSAEYVDGKFYIYYDKPNDEDPHLIIDEDLTDGKQGKEMGMVLNDPSHGSDMAVFRDDDGTFHIIYEDWSPVNARKHSWDSPLAGHADSPDGINGFLPHEHPAPIDQRTKSTGKTAPYKPAPSHLTYGPDQTPYTYEVHEDEQDAFGDYTMIKVGSQYYLFCDYDSKDPEKSMRIGRWRSDDIKKEFVWDGEVGEDFHPDPTVGFAEGKFYLIVQRNESDFISDGPWVDGVEMRAGVDTNDDGEIDQWTAFQKIKESYAQKEGFVRVINTTAAQLDVSELDEGYAFKLEFRMHKKDDVLPVLDAIEVCLE